MWVCNSLALLGKRIFLFSQHGELIRRRAVNHTGFIHLDESESILCLHKTYFVLESKADLNWS